MEAIVLESLPCRPSPAFAQSFPNLSRTFYPTWDE